MVDLTVLPGFVAVILVFLAPPGPDMAFMIAVGLESGRRPAVAAILGIGTGMSVYALAVVMGVAQLAESHPTALDAVKLVGAAYLAWLAWVTLRKAHERTTVAEVAAPRPGSPYRRGVIVSLTNPKVILFFLAVLPQFVGTAQSTRVQLAMLGAVNVASEVVLYGSIGVLAGAFHARFLRSARSASVLHYAAGIVYLVLASVIAAGAL
ncbi:threonine/homoserine/homoserine lactone efflux protein [Knoellia remsis]|uniref:Threonine/homoserine/homoserine lactone efflux protein n=1 Tax=Knoellia remsis TaxID=407159 RepID=A0A2T0UCG6_9MICO|nr:LysE family translocator [Knoellia remsis]PRY55630.1 threonine/homoserine/homoserine lactone efflux protein [Knoellia remsis]